MASDRSQRSPAVPDMDLLGPGTSTANGGRRMSQRLARQGVPELPPPPAASTPTLLGDYIDMGAVNTPFPPSPEGEVEIQEARNALNALQHETEYFEDGQRLIDDEPHSSSVECIGTQGSPLREHAPMGEGVEGDWSDAAGEKLCLEAAHQSSESQERRSLFTTAVEGEEPNPTNGTDPESSPGEDGLLPRLKEAKRMIRDMANGKKGTTATAKVHKDSAAADEDADLDAQITRLVEAKEAQLRRERQKERRQNLARLEYQYQQDLQAALTNSLRDHRSLAPQNERKVEFRLPGEPTVLATTSQDARQRSQNDQRDPARYDVNLVAGQIPMQATVAQVHAHAGAADGNSSDDEANDNPVVPSQGNRIPADLEVRVAKTVSDELKAHLDHFAARLDKSNTQITTRMDRLEAFVYGSVPATTSTPPTRGPRVPTVPAPPLTAVPVGPPGNPSIVPLPQPTPCAGTVPAAQSPPRSHVGIGAAGSSASLSWSTAFKLEPFDGCSKATTPLGRTIEVERWIQQVEMAATPPTDFARINLSRFTAKGDAWAFVNGPNLKNITDWGEFTKQIRVEFRGDLSADMCLAQLSALKKRSGETPREFMRRIKQIVSYIKNVHPDAIGGADYAITECFLNGLPASIGNWVRFQEGIRTPEDAERLATKIYEHQENGRLDPSTMADWAAGGPVPGKRSVQPFIVDESIEDEEVPFGLATTAATSEQTPTTAPTVINGLVRPAWSSFPVKPGLEQGSHYPLSERTGRYCKYHDSPWHNTDTCRAPWTECRVCEGATHVWTGCPWFQDRGRSIQFRSAAPSRSSGPRPYGRPNQVNAYRADPGFRVHGQASAPPSQNQDVRSGTADH